MTVSDRDRKVLMVLVPLVVLIGYWFLLLAPQRKEAGRLDDDLALQEQKRDAAQSRAQQLQSARATFASDYAALVRLGKAVPTTVDMPSVIVQLDGAAKGTGIDFRRIAKGEDPGGSSSSSSSAPAHARQGSGAPPAAAGGAPAQSRPGKVTETAGNKVKDSTAKNARSAEKSGAPPSGGAAKPPAGGAGAGASGPPCPPGLVCVPLELELKGRFFDLADFFHRLKRFVRLANDGVTVRGRLLTIDDFTFTSEQTLPRLSAQVGATIYLSPKSSGAAAGATPQGPATASGAGGQGRSATPAAATNPPAAPPTPPAAP